LKFLVVIPTIRQNRPGFESVMERITGSFTHPTELHILDGGDGKPETLNRAYDELLLPSDCDVYVTLDDDYIPGEDWQGTLAKTFDALPEVGALGIWMGDSQEMRDYLGAQLCGPEEEKDGARFRRIGPTHHIAGCMIAFRRDIAIAVGKLPACDLKYQIWEDAYRGRRVRVAGKELAFAVGAVPELYIYEDPPEYNEDKVRELEIGRPHSEEYLAKGGIHDPISLKVRRVLGGLKAKILGKK
jgi:hypothetical protein